MNVNEWASTWVSSNETCAGDFRPNDVFTTYLLPFKLFRRFHSFPFCCFFFHFQFYKPVLVLSFSVACGMNIRVRDLRVANACEVAP